GLYYFHARWYDPEVGRFVSKDTGLFSKNLYSFASGNPVLFYDPDGRETVLGLYIPSYVTLSGSFLQNKNRKPCPCNRSDLPLINDYIRFYQDMVQWYKNPEKHPEPKSPLGGEPGRAAHTDCTGGPTEGMATVYIDAPFEKDCFNMCLLKHEIAHAEQCHSMGMTQYYATYRKRTGEATMETAAYNSQISCLQGEKNRILGR
ncbi:MAG TPA: RHS repeat-associated core domain-containing protein, partial [bacterium]|nr:RHS repeat-associated core domain-containing protein [bacterium]